MELKSTYLKSKKPEMVSGVALVMMLIMPGIASATDTISTRAIGAYLTGEALFIFGLVLLLGLVGGLILIVAGSMSNNPNTKSKGYIAVAGVLAAIFLYYTVPGIIGQMGDMSSPETVFNFSTTNNISK